MLNNAVLMTPWEAHVSGNEKAKESDEKKKIHLFLMCVFELRDAGSTHTSCVRKISASHTFAVSP
jgi:hypothetical protein